MVTAGGSYDVVLAASSWLGDLQGFVVDLTNRVENDTAMDWNDVIYQGNAHRVGRQVAIPISTATTTSATTAATSSRTRV